MHRYLIIFLAIGIAFPGCKTRMTLHSSLPPYPELFSDLIDEFPSAVRQKYAAEGGKAWPDKGDYSKRYQYVNFLSGTASGQSDTGCLEINYKEQLPYFLEVGCMNEFCGLVLRYNFLYKQPLIYPYVVYCNEDRPPFEEYVFYEGYEYHCFIISFPNQNRGLAVRTVPAITWPKFQSLTLDDITSIYLLDEGFNPLVMARFEKGIEYFIGQYRKETSPPSISFSRRNESVKSVIDLHTVGTQELLERMAQLIDESHEEFGAAEFPEGKPSEWWRKSDPRMKYKEGFASAREEYGDDWIRAFHGVQGRYFDRDFPFQVPGEIKLPEER